MKRKSTLEVLRERRANTGFLTAEESFVSGIVESRAAGLTRQMTAEEIAAMMQADAADPQAALNRRRARFGLPPIG